MNPTRHESRKIRVAPGVIADASGRLLLVRKRGTSAFMQPGGKIEPRESPLDALVRELREELGLAVDLATTSRLGLFSANEPDSTVEAELFGLSIDSQPIAAPEIEEIIWLEPGSTSSVELAPLTRDVVLRLSGM
ncbi:MULTISPECIES: NUDIX domain-containing protein [unclassified Mesorhizobium]|uniref:NUDIX hydrolase n=1 Tax=unclassified Mesorhizobium TaxID=325217 RepID=UPI001128BBB2|nr:MULTISPECIES: NUDIX domain-containing protein [unclassified Mesorhizobium]MCA0028197.1 NUDIX domain-containing protein [Mesorhizobium sp. B263B1A]TPJ92109.1 NUDIX domain-containing protein [Mesorhizobium sp. B2-5-12]TPK24132.1 NUDIX domain-containing protein [Mesorhizobium sp. B2-5-6]TPK68453.1 NUDIX domain-containing protein [Mesorhizobium sp. B2-5-1]TPM62698.1 NUDIX domain-containing protein [Mesorhizobium sp. B2-1-9]